MDNERLDIPYVKLKFMVEFVEDTVVPRTKVSALRGSMGEILLRQNCVRDRKCKGCMFEEACLVRRMMYTYMKKKPAFMQGDDSIGYLLECEDMRTDIEAGDEMCFYLTLLGNNIVYWAQYLQVFSMVGNMGIGKYQSRFRIKKVMNQRQQVLVDGNNVMMSNFSIDTIGTYVERRMEQLRRYGMEGMLIFHTPLCLKYQGRFLEEFSMEAICQAVLRRIQMYDYFVEKYLDPVSMEEYPMILEQQVSEAGMRRYSSTQDQKIQMRGILGKVKVGEVSKEMLEYLLAGEILHIGKNSSFGFGRYTIK